jgi:signal transduction histidine kinase
MTDGGADAPPDARWAALQDELLRGLAHALSNRVATLTAVAYLLEHGDVSPAEAATSLRTESERMDDLLQLLRRLPAREAAAEPVLPGDLVADAVALHALHCDLDDVPVEVEVTPDVPPVLVAPPALRQAVLLALSLAKRAAVRRAVGGVQVTIGGDAAAVRLAVRAAPAPAGDVAAAADEADDRAALDLAAIRERVAGADGDVSPLGDVGCVLHLPSLAAARRAGH